MASVARVSPRVHLHQIRITHSPAKCALSFRPNQVRFILRPNVETINSRVRAAPIF